ncbi:MAG: GGDEF domain-containing protein [Gammaproteobacteria bacterium]
MSQDRLFATKTAHNPDQKQIHVAGSFDRTKRALIQQTAAMLMAAGVIAVVVAQSLTSLPSTVLIAALCTIGVCGVSMALARSRLPVAVSAGCLIGSWLTALFVVAYLRGGLDAPLLIAVPIVPLIAATVLSRRTASLVLVLILVALAILASLELVGHPFPQSSADAGNFNLMRAVWVALSSAMAHKLATYSVKRSETLALDLQRLALTDALTGVPNRRAIMASLETEVARAKRKNTSLSVLMLDIDRFKHLNDKRGHIAGDEALAQIAAAVSEQLRTGGDTIGRWGGEEFLAILSDASMEEALRAAKRVAQCIAELGIRYDQESEDVVTVTIGVAEQRGVHITTADDLVHRADKAMYRGKTEGRDRILCAEDAVSLGA